MATNNWKVNDRVLLIRPRQPKRYLEIVKVGRKWVELSDHNRFDINSRKVDGYCDAEIYRDDADYDYECKRKNQWQLIREAIECSYEPPTHLSQEDLVEIGEKISRN